MVKKIYVKPLLFLSFFIFIVFSMSMFALSELDWREMENAEIMRRGVTLYDDRVYVSKETMQKMLEARSWHVRELPATWGGYTRTANILYGTVHSDLWPEIIVPERDADKRLENIYGHMEEFWTVPAAPFEHFSFLSVLYYNKAGQYFYVQMAGVNRGVGRIHDVMDNGMGLTWPMDDWIHVYFADTLQGEDELIIHYKIGAQGSLDKKAILEFIGSL